MALSKKSKIALGVLGAAAAGGVVMILSQPKPKKKAAKPPCPEGEIDLGIDSSGERNCAPVLGEVPVDPATPEFNGIIPATLTPNKTEPLGGWMQRWNERRDDAIDWCRVNARRNSTWVSFWHCVLDRAFPEAASFTGLDRPEWLRVDAAAKVREDISAILLADEASTEGWRFMLWLKFDDYIEDCYEALAPHSESVAHCIASQIYPNTSWSPAPKMGWKAEFWNAILDKIDQYEEEANDASPFGGLNLTS